jgi:hypothetical protein
MAQAAQLFFLQKNPQRLTSSFLAIISSNSHESLPVYGYRLKDRAHFNSLIASYATLPDNAERKGIIP